jgi:predicted RNase H-like HicB family nuclease
MRLGKDKRRVSAVAARTSGYIVVNVVVEPDDGQFEAYCPDLDVSSFGDSREEAVNNAGDAILLHLGALAAHGEISEELDRRGVRIYADVPEQISLKANVRPGGSVTSFTAPIAAPTLVTA